MENTQEEREEDLRNELLEASAPKEPKKERTNSKKILIDKIIEVSERDRGSCEYSRSRLKRMSKAQLTEYLADLIEAGMKRKMAETVGVDRDADDRAIALGALRMIHDICATATEKGANSVLEPKGYTIKGFSQNLKEPSVSQAIDGCLEEIAQENQELLEYVRSPYTRLALAWGGAIAFSCKKTKHVTDLGTEETRRKNPVRRRISRRPPDGEKHPPVPPVGHDEKSV